ncbi:MAG: hypothetical protein JWM27_2560 [Gemmatimonadetes bacterium]|nr:hypothetical protein [Gemmatimonadota bacterium]
MEETVIRLEDRGQKVLALQEWAGQAAAAVTLALAGVDRMRASGGGLSGWVLADLAVAAVLLGAIAREVRGARRADADGGEHAGGGLGWVSILGGVVLFVEWGARVSAGGKVVSPLLLTGMLNAVQGLAQPWADAGRARRRTVRVGDAGLEVRFSMLRAFRASWTEIASVVEDRRGLAVTATDGRSVRVRRWRYTNLARVAAAVAEGARLHGVPVTREGPALAVRPRAADEAEPGGAVAP